MESTQEMLDEWRPLLCPFDVKMSEGLFFLQLFLPTIMYPHEYDHGFRYECVCLSVCLSVNNQPNRNSGYSQMILDDLDLNCIKKILL